MIAELFYSKEFKAHIAELKANDDLNVEAIQYITMMLYLDFFLVTVGFIVFIFKSVFMLFLYLFILIFFIYRSVQNSSKRVQVCTKGVLKKGIYEGITKCARGCFRINIINEGSSNDLFSMGPFHPLTLCKKKNFPKNGEEILYYSLGNRMEHNIPNYYPIKKKFCLSLSMLKE